MKFSVVGKLSQDEQSWNNEQNAGTNYKELKVVMNCAYIQCLADVIYKKYSSKFPEM